MRHKILSNTDILECLERSGYLLESSLVRELNDGGFFVEPNQAVLDPRTGKSRELDIVAEHYSYSAGRRGTCVKTYFVIEVVNNKFPVVLLTNRPSTPNSNFESYVKYGCTPEPNDFHRHFDFYEDRQPPEERFFSQYCALSEKRGERKEFMASHPEDMYASLQKMAEYVEREIDSFAEWTAEATSDIWRVFFWHPMLVVGGQLVVIEDDEADGIKTSEVTSAFLEFNWHQDGEPKTTVIEVVTAATLRKRMEKVVAADEAYEIKLHELHVKAGKDVPNRSVEGR